MDQTVATNILDLNDDCLREICEYLGLNDLCAFGNVCTRFSDVSRAHFASSTFKHTLVWNYSTTCSMVNEKYKVNTIDFLRQFGALIESITVMGVNYLCGLSKTNDQNRILRLLNRYCSETLQELVLWNFYLTEDTALLLRPLLRSIHRLRIEKHSLCDLFLKMLPEWAPELRELELDNLNSNSDQEKIRFVGLQPRFQHLERFSLKSVSRVDNDDVEEFLKWNPQLKQIELDGMNVTRTIYDLIFKHVPKIESVRLRISYDKWIEWTR